MFEAFFSNKAEKFLESCEPKLRARLKELFEFLQENPVPAHDYDLRKIEGDEDTYRIRLSSHRVIYAVYWNEKKIRVLKIERRSNSTYK